MDQHDHNLNIHYSIPEDLWEKLSNMYENMPHWYGRIDGCPYWYGNGGSEIFLCASVEPGGLQIYGQLPGEEWDMWFDLFKRKASDILGYEVGEPEDGYEFHFYN